MNRISPARTPIALYSWPTTNGRRVHIMLEELGWPYDAHAVNLETGEQRAPAFTALNPVGKIPAIVDPDGPAGKPITLFESGAILLYLAERSGRFLPSDPHLRYEALRWLMLHVGAGPVLGAAHHYRYYAPVAVPYAIDRSTGEVHRLYSVMEGQLNRNCWMGGDEYSVADMAAFPWIMQSARQGVDWREYPAVQDWYLRVWERPAVKRGIDTLSECVAMMAVPVSPPAPLSAPPPGTQTPSFIAIVRSS